MSLSRAATTLDPSSSRDPTSTSTRNPEETTIAYDLSTSLIVRAAIGAGVIVLVITAVLLFFKISQYLRTRRRRQQRRQKFKRRQMEQQASLFEVAAWGNRPGGAPVDMGQRSRRWYGMGMNMNMSMGMGGNARRTSVGGGLSSVFTRRGKKEDPGEKDLKVLRRGGANAYNVFEWEGTAQ